MGIQAQVLPGRGVSRIAGRVAIRAALLGVAVFLTATGALSGEIYKWIDEDGRIHYSDTAPTDKSAKNIEPLEPESKINTVKSVDVTASEFLQSAARARQEREKQKAAKNRHVVMYSTTWCGVCKSARKYFQANDIPFSEYDVETTERGRTDFARLQGRGVPIILIGDKRMDGFSPARFRKMYGG